jgi:hypothetical protein
MDCKENDCETIDDLGVYTYFLEAFRKLWTQVNVTGFQTFSPNSKIIVGPLPNATIITPSSVSTQDIIITNPSNINQSITLTYDNEFSDLQSKLYQLITMMTTFGTSPNMQALNAAYQTFISTIQSKYGDSYQELPWVYNPANISPSLLFYQPNLSSYLWIFFNSLWFSQQVYKSWYSLTSLSVVPYNNYTVPITTSTVSSTVSGGSPQVFNIFFYNEGTNYISSSGTIINPNTTYTYSTAGVTTIGTVNTVYRSSGSYGVCGISTLAALTTGSPNYGTTVTITGISGSSGAQGAISLGVAFSSSSSFPSTANIRYVSAQFTTVTGNIKDLLGSNASNPNCFAYYDPTYVATNSTGYRPLDIWSFVTSAQTISSNSIIYEYIGIVLQTNAPIITISGSNILFRNCVFNIKGATNTTFKITGSNVVFDRCIFRNPVSSETFNFNTLAFVSDCTITNNTVVIASELTPSSSSFSFVNNYINFNVNKQIYLFNLDTNYLKRIVSITKAAASTNAENYYICNNTIESTFCSNPFSWDIGAVLSIADTVFLINTGLVSIYYQLNIHLASQNYIFDRRIKDYPDLYINVSNSNQNNVSIYFLDLYANEGSNFLKVLVNYSSGPVPSARTSKTPFLYYDIQ